MLVHSEKAVFCRPHLGVIEHMQWNGGMQKSKGFGLLELMVTLVVASLLVTLAVPAYDGYVRQAKVTKAIGDIRVISREIEKFCIASDGPPPKDLSELPIEVPLDPWYRPYAYLNISTAGPDNGALRKDGSLNPLNTDYDLYSSGHDGESQGSLNAGKSRDDVVRANNGTFIGAAEDY